MTNTYEAPVLTVVGSVEGLTASTNANVVYDKAAFNSPVGSPNITKSSPLTLS